MNEDIRNHVFSVYNGNPPSEGSRVNITLQGKVVNCDEYDGCVWVELDDSQVEHVDTVGDRHLVLTVTDLRNTSPKVPEIAAGQVWSLDGVLYVVYRERPLSQAGELFVLNAMTGMLEDEEVLKGAQLVFDPIKE